MGAVDAASHAALPSYPTGLLQGHEGAVLCIAFNASGAYALTGGTVSVGIIFFLRSIEKEEARPLPFHTLFFFDHHRHRFKPKSKNNNRTGPSASGTRHETSS